MTIEIVGLHRYPVKGLQGISLEIAPLTPTGLAYDRHWMIVMPNGRMVTQRQMTKLATIKTSLSDSQLTLAVGDNSIAIDIDAVPTKRVPIHIWNDRFDAVEEDRKVSEWLTETLNAKHLLRLVRMSPDLRRPAPKNTELGVNVSAEFADAAPMLVTNIASLWRVNEALQGRDVAPVPMNRFRPNIEIRGLDAFEEYQQASLVCARKGYRIRLCYPSERCIVTTIDQTTGEKHAAMEPIATLKQMNTAPGLDGAYFGQNASLLDGSGMQISVGDELQLEQT